MTTNVRTPAQPRADTASPRPGPRTTNRVLDSRIAPPVLTRFAGVAAVAAGLLFIGVQVNHPHLDATTITTTDVAIRSSLKLLMVVLPLVGITGMYLRQVAETQLLQTPVAPPSDPRSRASSKGPTRGDWVVPILRVVLSLVPLIAGSVRLGELAGGAEVTDANARFFANPVPVVVHIVSASLFCVVGAFQFSKGLRRRYRRWHRGGGRALVPLGLAAGGSGLWLTLAYRFVEPDGWSSWGAAGRST